MARPAVQALGTLRARRQLPWYLEAWRRLVREKPLGTFGGVLVLAMLMMALLADIITPYGMNEPHLKVALQSYSRDHWLGTDALGRDLLTRCIYGARISIYVGLGAVGLGATAATIIGLVTGYFGGVVDAIIQRIVDTWMCFPWLVIVLTIMSFLGPGLLNVIFVLALSQAFQYSRVVRGAVLSIKENAYIEAARATGCSHGRILLVHVLPNVLPPVIVIATVGLGAVILSEAALSFLGFGVPPPSPSWGGMLSGSGLYYMYQAPWLAIWPGVLLSLAVFGFNMLGDGLRDVLDPRLRAGQGPAAGK